jgi:hypothetical protein
MNNANILEKLLLFEASRMELKSHQLFVEQLNRKHQEELCI